MSLSLISTWSYAAWGSICHQVGDLAAGAQALRADDELDGDRRVLRLQALDLGHGGVVRPVHAKHQLKGAPIALRAVAHQPWVHPGVDALQRFQQADPRGEGRRFPGPANAVRIGPGTPQRKQHVGDAGHGHERRQRLHAFRDCIPHRSSLPNAAWANRAGGTRSGFPGRFRAGDELQSLTRRR